MIGTVLHVTRKELRESSRDRRPLASGLLYGVWGPLVMVMAVAAIARARTVETTIVVSATGQQHAPALTRFMSERGVTLGEPAEAAAERIRRRELRAALAFDEDFAAAFEANRPAAIALLY